MFFVQKERTKVVGVCWVSRFLCVFSVFDNNCICVQRIFELLFWVAWFVWFQFHMQFAAQNLLYICAFVEFLINKITREQKIGLKSYTGTRNEQLSIFHRIELRPLNRWDIRLDGCFFGNICMSLYLFNKLLKNGKQNSNVRLTNTYFVC